MLYQENEPIVCAVGANHFEAFLTEKFIPTQTLSNIINLFTTSKIALKVFRIDFGGGKKSIASSCSKTLKRLLPQMLEEEKLIYFW